MPKRAARKAVVALLWTVAGIFFLYVVTLVVIHQPPVQDYILSLVEKRISAQTRGTVTIESFRTNVINSTTVYGIRASSRGASRDTLYLDKLHLDYSPPALLSQTIEFDLIRAENGRARVVRGEDGRLRFPLLPIPKREPAKKREKRPWTLTIDSAFMSAIDIAYDDRELGLSVSLRLAQGGIEPRDFDSLQAKIAFNRIAMRSPWWTGTLDTLYIHGIQGDSTVEFETLLLAGNEARLNARGTVPLTKNGAFDLSGALAAGLESLSGALLKEKGLSGSFTSRFEACGTLQSPRFNLTVTSPYASYRGYGIDSAFITARYTAAGSLLVAADLESRYGNATVDATVDLPGLFLAPAFEGYAARVDADIPKITAILRKAGINARNISGSARLALYVRGDSLAEIPDSANMTLVVKETGSQRLNSARAHLIVSNARWRMQALLGQGNRIAGRGVVRLPRTLRGSVRGTIGRPERLSSFFLQKPVTGSLTFDASFRDALRNPKLQARLHSDSLAWSGAALVNLDAAVSYDRQWLIDRSHAFVRADLGEVAVDALEGIDGYLSAQVSAEGELTDPRVRAAVEVDNPEARGYGADRLAARLRYADRVMRWDSLYVRKDTLRLYSEGALDFGAPYRSLKTMLRLDAGEFPVTTMFVTGNLARDSLSATATIDYALPGRIVPGIPRYHCYEGVVRLGAMLGDTRCVRSGEASFDLTHYSPALPGPYFLVGAFTADGAGIDGNARIRAAGDGAWVLAARMDARTVNECLAFPPRFAKGSSLSVTARNFEYGIPARALLPRLTARGALDGEVKAVFDGNDWLLSGAATVAADTLAYPPANVSVDSARVEFGLGGAVTSPRVTFDLMARAVEYANESMLSVTARGAAYSCGIRIDTLSGEFDEGGFVVASGTVPLGGRTDAGARFSFRLRNAPIALINPFLASLRLTSGTLSGYGRAVFGEEIDADGRLEMNDARFTVPGCDLGAGPVSAGIRFAGDSVILEALSGRVGKGAVRAEGFAEIAASGIKDFGIELAAKNVRIGCEDFPEVGIDNALVRYSKSENRYRITAGVSLDNTRISETITIPQIIGGIKGGPGPGAPAPPVFRNTQLNATVDLRRNLIFDTNFGRLLLDGKMTVRGTLAQPQFNGLLQVAEGRVRYLDRNFDIEKGTIRQYTPNEINPDLNITASTEVTDFAFTDPRDYTVSVTVHGTLRDPRISLVSDPPLEQKEIVTLLTLGRTDAGSGLGLRAGEVASAQIAGLGSQLLEQAIPIDEISITGNLFALPEGGGPTLTLRENITPDLTLIYQTGLTDPSRQGVQVAYRVLPYLRLTAGTQTEGSSDVGFRFSLRR